MTERLNILVLQPDFSRSPGTYYQHQFTEALGRVHQIFQYGPNLEYYDADHSIEDVLRLCPFHPDLICFAAGWEMEDPAVPGFNPHPAIRTSNIDIPSVMVLNKEYYQLESKLLYIQANDIKLVFTTHHQYREWQEQTGVPFVHFPFAVDPTLFNDYAQTKRYELGFSGALHRRWTDTRVRIKNHLFFRWPIKTPAYWRTRLFWHDDSLNPTSRFYRFRGAFRLGEILGLNFPRGEDYARLINGTKIWLSTPSAIDLVGTRFYEVMASKTLLFCSRSDAYEGLFVDGVHCVMFDPDLSDFDDKFLHYLRNDTEREEIVERGYQHVLENHTWERRIEQFTDAVRKNVL